MQRLKAAAHDALVVLVPLAAFIAAASWSHLILLGALTR